MKFILKKKISKQLIVICLVFYTITAFSYINNTNILFNRLKKINSFYVTFIQHVNDSKGKILYTGKGKLWVKHPNLFYWHTTYPDESKLISDGKNLWLYNPIIEQVIVKRLENVINNTPLALIATNDISNWYKYFIKRRENIFTVIPKSYNNNLKRFIIKVTSKGYIKKIIIIDQNDQNMSFYLKNQKNFFINNSQFYFTVPKEATLDDQR